MRTPANVLAEMIRSDPGRPRVTWYDDAEGPTRGERIELSAKVLGNWVSKAGNALQEEWDLAPGQAVRLCLPPHWRTVVWAMAVWSVGGCVDLDDSGEETVLTVSDDPGRLEGAGQPGVLVTLASLARAATLPVPPGVMDEARELSTYPDQLTPWEEPAAADPALRAGGRLVDYDTVVEDRGWEQGVRVHTRSTSSAEVLADALAAFAVDGSVVLGRGEVDEAVLAERLRAEGVTLDR